MKKIVGIIPARGGSKGIPRKNIKLLCGKPLIQYSIEAALKSQCLGDVYVSTEDKEIAALSEKLGAKIIARPAHLAGDTVSTFDVIKQVDEVLGSSEIIVVLQPTSPLRTSQEIDEAVNLLSPDVDTVVGVCEMKRYLWEVRGDTAQPRFEQRLPRQLMPAQYFENGAMYVTRSKVYRNHDDKLGMGISSTGKIKLYLMPDHHSYEIDNEFDWNVTETLIHLLKKEK